MSQTGLSVADIWAVYLKDVFFCKFSVPSKLFSLRACVFTSTTVNMGHWGHAVRLASPTSAGQRKWSSFETTTIDLEPRSVYAQFDMSCVLLRLWMRMREYACVRRRPDMCFLDRMQNIGIFCIDRRSNQAVLNKARTSSRFPILKYTRKRQATFIEHGMTKT